MDAVLIAPVLFLLLETTNVITLYFVPGSRKANGMGVFAAWEGSKADPQIHDLVRYLVYWVAGTKLIFILLLGAILAFGDARLQAVALGLMVVAIATFYWRLFPLIRRMDREGQITPKGYSTTLAFMIGVFMLFLAAAGGLRWAAVGVGG